MLIDPASLRTNMGRIEDIEKASMRLVVQAIYDFRETAAEIFEAELDKAQDKAEDITREALDVMGVSRIPARLFGKIDYKKPRYVFHPGYAVKQALLVDSKAEKGSQVARIQTGQTSMRIMYVSGGRTTDEKGTLPTIITAGGDQFLTTTIFVKYNYRDTGNERHELRSVVVAALPSGLLQSRYNPEPENTIWNVGPHSTARGEDFRVRLSFAKLRQKAQWRIQTIPPLPEEFVWAESVIHPATP